MKPACGVEVTGIDSTSHSKYRLKHYAIIEPKRGEVLTGGFYLSNKSRGHNQGRGETDHFTVHLLQLVCGVEVTGIAAKSQKGRV